LSRETAQETAQPIVDSATPLSGLASGSGQSRRNPTRHVPGGAHRVLPGTVYVFHVFQTKSGHDSRTPREGIQLTRTRLKLVRAHHDESRRGASLTESWQRTDPAPPTTDDAVWPSSGNVVAGLGLEGANGLAAKADAARTIPRIIMLAHSPSETPRLALPLAARPVEPVPAATRRLLDRAPAADPHRARARRPDRRPATPPIRKVATLSTRVRGSAHTSGRTGRPGERHCPSRRRH
jgi:hypothetical protein